MSRRQLHSVFFWGLMCLGGLTQPAWSQGWMPFGGGSCGTCSAPRIPTSICGPVCPQVSYAPPPQISCAPPPPQFVQVPVTEMRPVKQIVHRPVCETKMVAQQVTAYRTEVENRVATVPTMQYQTVQECQTRVRDAGQWVTNYRCRPQVHPCAIDNRPGLLGALNRNLYAARMALTPAIVAERSYVPNYITEQIPVTRQVAVPGQRQVAYQVSRVVPYTTTRQVAVNSVRMVAEEVTTQQAVTVYKTVPYATAMGMNPGYGATAISPGFGTSIASPVPDPAFSRSASNVPNTPVTTPVPGPTNRPTMQDDGDTIPGSRSGGPGRGSGASLENSATQEVAADDFQQPVEHATAYRPSGLSNVPSIIRVAQWSGRSLPAVESQTASAQISVAKN